MQFKNESSWCLRAYTLWSLREANWPWTGQQQLTISIDAAIRDEFESNEDEVERDTSAYEDDTVQRFVWVVCKRSRNQIDGTQHHYDGDNYKHLQRRTENT